jgi:hypothetical protein
MAAPTIPWWGISARSSTTVTTRPVAWAMEVRPGRPTPDRNADSTPYTLPPASPASRIQVGTTAARNAGPYTSGSATGAATATGTATAAGTHHVRRMAARASTTADRPPKRA